LAARARPELDAEGVLLIAGLGRRLCPLVTADGRSLPMTRGSPSGTTISKSSPSMILSSSMCLPSQFLIGRGLGFKEPASVPLIGRDVEEAALGGLDVEEETMVRCCG
jgi:hypothetical protein